MGQPHNLAPFLTSQLRVDFLQVVAPNHHGHGQEPQHRYACGLSQQSFNLDVARRSEMLNLPRSIAFSD